MFFFFFSFLFPLSLRGGWPTMARTMGEVLPSSFHALFSLAPRPRNAGPSTDDGPAAAPSSLFVDVGSGYGTLCVAAVNEYGFGAAVGIEKYR